MERSRSVDILRAMALLVVCFGRHMIPCPLGAGEPVQAFLYHLTTGLSRGGWVGVDLFFVLSGFLVSGLLFREHQACGNLSAKNFLIRRGLKIYPAFWLMILVSATVKAVQQDVPTTIETLSELLFVQNYGPALWPHTWSLAVEEHFYLLLVMLLLWLSRRPGVEPFKLVPGAFLALAVLSLAARLLTARAHPYTSQASLLPSHLRMDSLFFGVLISYFHHYRSEQFKHFARRFRVPLVAAGLLGLLPAFLIQLETHPFMYTFGFTVFYLASGALLVASTAITLPNYFAFRFGAYLGSHSYSIYLWHIPLAICAVMPLARALHWEWPLYAIVTITSAVTVGIIMALLVEFPTLRARDKYFPRRTITP